MTIQEAAAGLRKLQRERDRPIFNGVRRVLRSTRKLAVERIRQRGIGRALWGGEKRGAAKGGIAQIKTIRLKRTGSTIVGGFDLKGVAALMETGGRTKPHTIRPALKERLSFKSKAFASSRNPEGWLSAREVNHPGGPVRALGLVGAEVRKSEGLLVAEVDREQQAQVTAAGF